MAEHPGANAALDGLAMMQVDDDLDEDMADTEPETSDRNSGTFVRSTSGLHSHNAQR